MPSSPAEPKAHRAPGLRRRADRWNLFCNIADGAFAIFAFELVSVRFVLPAFLREAGASDRDIGLVSAAQPLVTVLVPILVAGYVQELRRKKRYVLAVGAFQRLHFFIVPFLAVALLPGRTTLFLALFVASTLLKGVANQAQWPAWTDLVAKVTPVDRRGFLFGWRLSIGVVAAMLAAGAVHWALTTFEFPYGYAALFCAGGLSFLASLGFVALLRERPGKVLGEALSPWQSLRGVPRLLRRDANFSWFLTYQVLSSLALGSVAIFFVLTAADRLGAEPKAILAQYMVVNAVCVLVGNLVFARVGDRLGHKASLVAAGPLFVAGCAVALFARTQIEFGAVFVLLGLATSARRVSTLTMGMEFGPEAERPRYMAVLSICFMPLMRVGPAIGGAVRHYAGAEWGFVVAMVLSVLATTVLVTRVRDPRRATVAVAEGADAS